jgi:predicted SAM-dependent methyltransferase
MVKYYENEIDPMWKWEIEKLLPWFYGKGVDIGCGERSINKNILRVDIDEKVKPDIICSGDSLPFKDAEFDYVCSIHTFEHFEDQVKTLKEWLRIIKKGGIIGIVHPDVSYTKKQLPPEDNPSLKGNPFNKHFYEHTLASFLDQLKKWPDIPFKIIDYGKACEDWSFYVILKKI